MLDRPEAVWDDPAMDRIYEDLRGEFDLADRIVFEVIMGAAAALVGLTQ